MHYKRAQNHSMIVPWPKLFFDCIRFNFICFIVCNLTSCLIRYIVIANHFIHETHRLRKRFSFPFRMYTETAFYLCSSCNKALSIVEQEKAIYFMWIVCFSMAFSYITIQYSVAEYYDLFFFYYSDLNKVYRIFFFSVQIQESRVNLLPLLEVA